MRRFLLTPDNETGELYLLCTEPFSLYLVRPDALTLVKGEADAQGLMDAELFIMNSSFKRIEFKIK
jgi:hypothetical protein